MFNPQLHPIIFYKFCTIRFWQIHYWLPTLATRNKLTWHWCWWQWWLWWCRKLAIILPVGTVIKGALHPLCGSCMQSISREGHKKTGYGTTPLTLAGSASVLHLICICLVWLKSLFHLFHTGQKSDVCTDLKWNKLLLWEWVECEIKWLLRGWTRAGEWGEWEMYGQISLRRQAGHGFEEGLCCHTVKTSVYLHPCNTCKR